MNKFYKWLILSLINKEIRKKEKAALKKMRKSGEWGVQNRVNVLLDALHNDGQGELIRSGDRSALSYTELIGLKKNFETIDNPWQGLFAHYWIYSWKNPKSVEPFPPLESKDLRHEQNEFFDEEWDGSDEAIDRWIESYESAMDNLAPEEWYEAWDEKEPIPRRPNAQDLIAQYDLGNSK